MPPAAAMALLSGSVSVDIPRILARFSSYASFSINKMKNMSIHQKIRAGRLKLGMTEQQFGDAVGVSRGAVQQWEKEGGTAPTRKNQPAVAKLLGMTVAELMGDTVISGGEIVEIAGSSLTPIFSWEHENDLPQGEYVFVPRLDIKLSAGGGKEQVEIDFVKKMPQAFRADWIRLKRLQPNKLAAMKVDGESMEPFIWDGETVIVDTSQNTVKDGKVYAMWYDGGERVKRLYRLPGGGLRIDSDNPKHSSIEVHADHLEGIRIIGRVVHKQGDGGL